MSLTALPGEDIQRLIDHAAVRKATAEHFKNVIILNLKAYEKSCQDIIALYDATIEAENNSLKYLTNVMKNQLPERRNAIPVIEETPEIVTKDFLEVQDTISTTEVITPSKKSKNPKNLNGTHNEQSDDGKK